MKKILLSVLLVAACVSAIAKERDKASRQPDHKFEVNVGCATFPVVDMFVSGNLLSCLCKTMDPHTSSVSQYYSDYDGNSYLFGLFSASFSYRFNKWFALDAQANFDAVVTKTYSGLTNKVISHENDYLASVLAYARFTYCNKKKVYLYSSVGAGAGMYATTSNGVYMVFPELQVAPLGVVVGKKVYGLFELGLGSVYCGLKVGLGVKF